MGQPYHTMYLDNLQLLLLAICIFDMIFFSYYLFVYEISEQHTISDTLFSNVEYVTILSITLTCRMLGAVFFLTQYRYERWGWMVAGYIGVFLTLLGWCVPNFKIVLNQGKVLTDPSPRDSELNLNLNLNLRPCSVRPCSSEPETMLNSKSFGVGQGG